MAFEGTEKNLFSRHLPGTPEDNKGNGMSPSRKATSVLFRGKNPSKRGEKQDRRLENKMRGIVVTLNRTFENRRHEFFKKASTSELSKSGFYWLEAKRYGSLASSSGGKPYTGDETST